MIWPDDYIPAGFTPYHIEDAGIIFNCDCRDILQKLPKVDLVLTSPPYDSLRTYKGYGWIFEDVAKGLENICKDGATIVWIVNDETIDGSETGTSFRQVLFFMELGLKLNDTMIWEKCGFTATGSLPYRYGQVFEYMFILTKGKIKTFNPLKDREKIHIYMKKHGSIRQKDGTLRKVSSQGKLYTNRYSQRFNIWKIPQEMSNLNRFHPAQFPEQIAKDHILSWSNINDLVLDCHLGSGTTAVTAKKLGRKFIGIEISEEYCAIAVKRLRQKVFNFEEIAN